MEIRQDDPSAPHVAPLLAEHVAEQHGNVPPGFAFALDANGLSAPGVTFWTLTDGTGLAGFVALKQLAAEEGEVKSMRVAADRRGRGYGHALLDHVVATARRRGYRRLYLETGTTAFYDAAIALYRGAGFVDCGPFADYAASPHNRFLTLAL
ncbi:N-acetyltransferase [Sphingomonas metalli]|uniref:N-acetyltransferase n=1 Tax=Sphingomonas metalli TaxID=1779358 RepID=A0A916WYC8_9SPHN|nr:GNAT family N-acetyltransferase [Sphingomonas metalli]GGB39470.1 N-acetyltransferase [Sphingomonas metalli]